MSSETSPAPSKKGPIGTIVGALVAAALASACCVGPLLLGLAGLGGAGLLVRLERFRPFFGAITLSLLALGFYLTYRRPVPVPVPVPVDDACGCEPSPRRRGARIALWLSSVVTLGVLIGGPRVGRFASASATSPPNGSADAVTVLHVDEMTCASCAGPIRGALAKIDGVHEVQIDIVHKRVRVSHEPGTAPAVELISAIGDAGFTAREES